MSMTPTRREVLKLGAAGAALGGLSLTTAFAATPRRNGHASRKPRNVIFMVSDGMSAGVPSLAEPFSHLVRQHGTHWAGIAQMPGTSHGHMDMASLDSLVTDSAAAVSAWATGSRINNGAINMLPDGTELKPLGVLAKDRGLRVGLVTSTRLTHATPAGFVAVARRRSMEDEIAPQLIAADVLMGGGSMHFSDELIEGFRRDGYQIFRDRHELMTARGIGERVLGLFSASHFPYAIDRQHDAALGERVPTLAEMTRAALMSLSHHDEGFLLQVEGGRVDHAAHANDAAALMWEQLDFDNAMGVVYEFSKDRDDTLVIMTSDHANANPGLNGLGAGYRSSSQSFARLADASASFSQIEHRLRDARDAQQVAAIVKAGTRIEIEEREATVLLDVLQHRPIAELNRSLSNFRGQLGQVLGNYTGVTFTSVSHTADWVMAMAIGPGSENFRGLMRNTDVFIRLAELMNINHRNPVADAAARPTREP